MKAKEKARDAIVFSDAHLRGNDQNLEKVELLIDSIEKKNPAVLILNGDILDRWLANWETCLSSPSWKAIKQMISRRGDGNPPSTYYVRGNHDWTVSQQDVAPAKLCDYLELTIGGRKYLLIHGWQFDVTWRGLWHIPGISSIAFLIATRMPSIMVWVYRRIYGNHTPAKKKEKAVGLCNRRQTAEDTIVAMDAFNDWTLHIGVVHLRTSKHAHDKKIKAIIGHTHSPSLFNGLMADDGDMTETFSYLHITKEGVELKLL